MSNSINDPVDGFYTFLKKAQSVLLIIMLLGMVLYGVLVMYVAITYSPAVAGEMMLETLPGVK